MFTKRKLDLDEQKARVVGAVLGLQLFPKKHIYKEYYDLTDEEIDELEALLDEEMEKMQEAMGDPMGGGMAPPMGGGMAPPGGEPNMDMEAGGQESAENVPPTNVGEDTIIKLERLKNQVLLDEGVDSLKGKAIIRVVARLQEKVKK